MRRLLRSVYYFCFCYKSDSKSLPFQSVYTTKDVLASGFSTKYNRYTDNCDSVDFFEGFNYVVKSDKIDRRFPAQNRWLNWGAITCDIMCLLIHGVIGVTVTGIIEMICMIVIIYGMLMVKEFTGNAWGCVAIFYFCGTQYKK